LAGSDGTLSGSKSFRRSITFATAAADFADAPLFAGGLLQSGIRVDAEAAGDFADGKAGNNQSPESTPIDLNRFGHEDVITKVKISFKRVD